MTIRVLISCAVVLLTGWVSAPEKAEDAAQSASDAWLKIVDDARYEASWDEAAALFKQAVTKDQWKAAVAAARGPLGKLVSRKVKSREYKEQLPGAPDGKYVVIQYDAVFENKASAVETVTPMVDPDGEWRVSGYFIR
jgi:Protein of unknown function (DUF4019)